VARSCKEAWGDRAKLLGKRLGGTVVLVSTGWPCHFSVRLHGLYEGDFCGVLVGVCAWLFCGGSLRGKGGILREWKSGLRLVT